MKKFIKSFMVLAIMVVALTIDVQAFEYEKTDAYAIIAGHSDASAVVAPTGINQEAKLSSRTMSCDSCHDDKVDYIETSKISGKHRMLISTLY